MSLKMIKSPKNLSLIASLSPLLVAYLSADMALASSSSTADGAVSSTAAIHKKGDHVFNDLGGLLQDMMTFTDNLAKQHLRDMTHVEEALAQLKAYKTLIDTAREPKDLPYSSHMPSGYDDKFGEQKKDLLEKWTALISKIILCLADTDHEFQKQQAKKIRKELNELEKTIEAGQNFMIDISAITLIKKDLEDNAARLQEFDKWVQTTKELYHKWPEFLQAFITNMMKGIPEA